MGRTANKRFYWLQLKQDFFNSKEMKMLRKIAGGDIYTIIYLKLMLLSLEDDGMIFFEGIAKSLAEELSLVIDEEYNDIEIVLQFLQSKKLLSQKTENSFFFEQVPELTGSETASTRRARVSRGNKKALQCNTNATKRNGEIEKEKDLELKLYKELYLYKYYVEKNLDFNDYLSLLDDKNLSEVKKTKLQDIWFPVAYLNMKSNHSYKFIDKTKALVKARYDEGFTPKDFISVIEYKVEQWQNDNEMAKYLRPETLFGNKMDRYLNEASQSIAKNATNIPKWASEEEKHAEAKERALSSLSDEQMEKYNEMKTRYGNLARKRYTSKDTFSDEEEAEMKKISIEIRRIEGI